MKKLLLIVAVCFLAFPIGCKKSAYTGTRPSVSPQIPSGSAVATVGGAAITIDELDRAAQGQLQKVDMEIYQIKKRVLDDMIEDKLLEDAAKKKGLSVEKFLAEEIDAKISPPVDEEVKSLYDSSKERLGKSFDEVKGQIADYLKQNKKARARADLIASLKKNADVKVNLEPPRVQIDIGDAPVQGDKGAAVTLIEFSDYQCPFCKRVRPTIWKLLEEYKGKLRYVFMDFPLSFHKDAKKAHEAAHCAADQGKYFEYNRKIFDNQGDIDVASLKKYAKDGDLQLKTADFDKCLDSGKHTKVVEGMVQKGINAGVSGTPAYFVNGIMLSGAMPYESFKEVIESELKK